MRVVALIYLVTLVLVLVACSPGSDINAEMTRPTTAQSTTSPALSKTSQTPVNLATDSLVDRDERAYFFRGCSTRIFHSPHNDTFRESPDAIGPLQLLRISVDPPRVDPDLLGPDDEGRYEGFKYVTVVSGAAVGPVSLSIAPDDLSLARLVYDPEWSDTRSWEDADAQVRFEVCEDGDTQYNGGFIVRRPGCVEIVVTDHADPRDSAARIIPFSTTDC